MKYVIIALDGRQLYLNEDSFFITSLILKPTKTFLLLNKILLVKSNTILYLGQPYVIFSFIKIISKIIEHALNSKLIIFKMRAKKKYRHHLGYKHKITKLSLYSIKC